MQAEAEPTIFFSHIPKTAGSSIFASAVEFFGVDHVAAGLYYNDAAALRPGELANYKYIQLHYPLVFRNKILGDCFCFTFLRNPGKRLVSLYNFWRDVYIKNPDGWSECTGPYVAGNQSFADFLINGAVMHEIFNLQTRYIAGDYLDWSMSGINNSTLRQAVNEVSFIGFTENYAHSINILNSRLGRVIFAPNQYENRTIITRESVFFENINHIERERLSSVLEWDTLLYKLVTSLYSK